MKIGILGTGTVGETIATKLATRGHDVMMGSRSATNEKAVAWAKSSNGRGRAGTFRDAATHGELVFNCTSGAVSLDVMALATPDALAGKILVDVANPLDFSRGMPPTLTVANTDSLGEQIQRALPSTKVVKTLNTVNCQVMVDPKRVPGDHALFVCGDDPGAKSTVTAFLEEQFGWTTILDVGGISSARATEAYVTLWVRLYGTLGTADFNIGILRA